MAGLAPRHLRAFLTVSFPLPPFGKNHGSLKTWQTLFNLNTHARFSRTGSGATSTTGRAVLSASCDATVKPEPVFTFHPTWFVGGLRGREGRDKERGGEMNVLRQLRIVPPLFLALSLSLSLSAWKIE